MPDSPDACLHDACRSGAADTVLESLGNGADPNAVPASHGMAPLHTAIIHGHTAITAILLRAGADPGTRDGVGRTALHHAVISDIAQSENPRLRLLLQLLINYEAPLNGADHEGATPLHYCAIYNRLGAAKQLLIFGADPNLATSEYALTPCHIAALEKEEAMVRLLLHYGADATRKTRQGWSVQSLLPAAWKVK